MELIAHLELVGDGRVHIRRGRGGITLGHRHRLHKGDALLGIVGADPHVRTRLLSLTRHDTPQQAGELAVKHQQLRAVSVEFQRVRQLPGTGIVEQGEAQQLEALQEAQWVQLGGLPLVHGCNALASVHTRPQTRMILGGDPAHVHGRT